MKFVFLKIVLLLSFLMLGVSSCKRNSIPCPGNGTASARDLSLFDDEGNLKSEKKKKKGKDDNGLVRKKQDDRLKARRKRYLGDTRKDLKK